MPENILIENGHAVVADFGIAPSLSTVGAEKLTMTGMALGTPRCMSPEQASGDAVDARSDLRALGCVVYEMLAGAPPFCGPTAMAVMGCRARLRAHQPAARGCACSLDDAIARIAHCAGLLTVTGVGGTGKTRFAMQLFKRLQAQFADGAAFVSLASVTEPAEVLATCGTTLDLAEAHGRSPVEAAVTVIGNRQALLVIDIFEQVLCAAADVADLLARCPRLHVITTSRAPLKVGAEVEFVLAPLDPPATTASLAELRAYPSVAPHFSCGRRR